MANRTDIITRAFQRLNIVAKDEAPAAEHTAVGVDMLTDILADLAGPQNRLTLTFGMDTTTWPPAVVEPMIGLLAARLAQNYPPAASPMSETGALMRVRAVLNPYVRDMDFDKDGTVSEGEERAFDEGAYF